MNRGLYKSMFLHLVLQWGGPLFFPHYSWDWHCGSTTHLAPCWSGFNCIQPEWLPLSCPSLRKWEEKLLGTFSTEIPHNTYTHTLKAFVIAPRLNYIPSVVLFISDKESKVEPLYFPCSSWDWYGLVGSSWDNTRPEWQSSSSLLHVWERKKDVAGKHWAFREDQTKIDKVMG